MPDLEAIERGVFAVSQAAALKLGIADIKVEVDQDGDAEADPPLARKRASAMSRFSFPTVRRTPQ